METTVAVVGKGGGGEGRLEWRGRRRWAAAVSVWEAVVAGDEADVVGGAAQSVAHTPGLLHVLVHGCGGGRSGSAGTGQQASMLQMRSMEQMRMALIDLAQDAAHTGHGAHALCGVLTLAAATLVIRLCPTPHDHSAHPPPAAGGGWGGGEVVCAAEAKNGRVVGETVGLELGKRVMGMVSHLVLLLPGLASSQEYWLLKLALAQLFERGGDAAQEEGVEDSQGVFSVERVLEAACRAVPESRALERARLTLLHSDSQNVSELHI